MKIKLDLLDKFLEVSTIIGLIVLIAMPIYYYNSLPDSLPMHYGFDGKPDKFGIKTYIFVLPVIGMLLYLGFKLINRHPDKLNLGGITPSNPKKQYSIVAKAIRILSAIVIFLFIYINNSTFEIAIGNRETLGSHFILIFIILTSIIPLFFIYKSSENKE